jgi:hypothetical protein
VLLALSYYSSGGGDIHGVPVWICLILGVLVIIALGLAVAQVIDTTATWLDRRASDRLQPGASPRR